MSWGQMLLPQRVRRWVGRGLRRSVLGYLGSRTTIGSDLVWSYPQFSFLSTSSYWWIYHSPCGVIVQRKTIYNSRYCCGSNPNNGHMVAWWSFDIIWPSHAMEIFRLQMESGAEPHQVKKATYVGGSHRGQFPEIIRTPHHCMVFHYWYSTFFIFSFCHIFFILFWVRQSIRHGFDQNLYAPSVFRTKGTYTCCGIRCSLWTQSDWTISKTIPARW